MRLSMSKDTIAALCLIMACGGLMLASLDIREPDYGVLSPAAWPRLIIVIMGVLSVIFFLQSAFGNGQNTDAAIAAVKDAQSRPKESLNFYNIGGMFLLFSSHSGFICSFCRISGCLSATYC